MILYQIHCLITYYRVTRFHMIKSFIQNKQILSNSWSYYLIFCEHINFLNVILQAWLIDRFLGRQFLNLGNHIIENGFNNGISILEYVFPKVSLSFCKYYSGENKLNSFSNSKFLKLHFLLVCRYSVQGHRFKVSV